MPPQTRKMMEEPEITGRPADTMTFMDATKTCFRKSLTISGRASRSEMWYFTLASFLGMICLTLIDGLLGGIGISLLALALFPGAFTVSIRRMHDIGKSGWMMLLFVIPLVGIVLQVMWFIVDAGQPHANQYGDVPTNTLE